MNTSFRPHESAGIGEGLRTRLEGSIELLEDALPLLDSLRYLLARVETSKDDIATLHECVNQLPRIDEAIDHANKHEQAHGLTAAVGTRKEQALMAANERLVTLGRAEQPSLRAAVISILELVKRQGLAPQEGEVRLMESEGPPWLLGLLLSAGVASIFFLFDWPLAGAIFGALIFILTLYLRDDGPWVLLPDRLFFPARWPKLSREFSPDEIQSVSVNARIVTLSLKQERLLLRSSAPDELVTKVRLLGSTWLSRLQSPARPFVIVDAVDDTKQAKGRALLSKEGVLFVPSERSGLLVGALATRKLPKEPTIDEVLGLIAHLPEGRWAALGEHLEKSADATWISSDDGDVEENVVRLGERNIRLLLANSPQRGDAEKLLEAF